ncbi:MAG: protease, partial [Actinomycetota bacterium]|nr:protease [Actinomycetota bacterium]
TVRGQIVGRGMPGYVLSPDLVVADASGFVPLLYRQPIPFAAELFGLFRAGAFQGQEVVARGWYRRAPGPVIELREVWTAGGRRARAWEWAARYAASVFLVLAGVALMLVGVV